MLARLVAMLVAGLARVLTGVLPIWRGCLPESRQRVRPRRERSKESAGRQGRIVKNSGRPQGRLSPSSRGSTRQRP